MDALTVLWMALVLKIPIAPLLWLVWYAAKEPEPVGADEDDGGSKRPDGHTARARRDRRAAVRTPARRPRATARPRPPSAIGRAHPLTPPRAC